MTEANSTDLSNKTSPIWSRSRDLFRKVSFYRNKNILLFLIWIFLGSVFALRTISFSQQEDMGFFLSEAALISRGHALYEEIFELKDPLFLWLSGLSFLIAGKSGPYLLDSLLVVISAPVAYFTARALGSHKYLGILSAILFTGSLSGVFYNTFRSGIAALILIVLSFLLAVRHKHILLGIVCVSVIGFKMPYAPMLIGPILISLWNQPIRKWLHFLSGVAVSSLIIVLTLAVRGELHGYFYMVRYNFRYRADYSEIVGLPTGFSGRLSLIEGYGSNLVWLLIAVTVVTCLLLWRITNSARLNLLGLGLSEFVVILVLLSSVMWVHHLQPLSLLLWAFTVSLGVALKDPWKINRGVSLGILLLPLVMQLSGWRFPTQSALPVSKIINPDWITPPEADFVQSIEQNLQQRRDFARLGNVDDLGLAAFLPKDWQLVCRQYGQAGSESQEDIDELTHCLRTRANYIFVSPGFFALERPAGNYGELKNEISLILADDFECLDVPNRSGAQFCERNTTPGSR